MKARNFKLHWDKKGVFYDVCSDGERIGFWSGVYKGRIHLSDYEREDGLRWVNFYGYETVKGSASKIIGDE